jgi:predicted transcriptional regulator
VRVKGNLQEKIIAQFADAESRKIISSVRTKPKTVMTIGSELKLPQSTVYRKVLDLKECGLLMVHNFVFRPDGKREALYECTFSELRFKTRDDEIEVVITLTERALEKRWLNLFLSRATQ